MYTLCTDKVPLLFSAHLLFLPLTSVIYLRFMWQLEVTPRSCGWKYW